MAPASAFAAVITSSSEVVDCEDNVIFSLSFAAVLATSDSPSPPASFYIALGANAIGRDDFHPKSAVVVSIELTCLRIRVGEYTHLASR
jgi:hypothetical protein